MEFLHDKVKSHMFEPQLQEENKCPLCDDVLKDPHLLVPCGHIFCRNCIHNSTHAPKCPLGGKCDFTFPEEEYKVVPNKNVLRKIDSLTVRCPNDTQCEWKDKLSSLKTHFENCDFQLICCPLECGINLARRDTGSHCKDNCKFREVECQYCKSQMQWSTCVVHEKTCCPNGCDERTETQTVEEHLKVCLLQPIPCVLFCTTSSILRKNLSDHVKYDCPEREVQCEFCQKNMKWKDCVIHSVTCCPNQCGERMKDQSFEEHKKLCTLELIVCDFGCKGIRRMDFKKHLKESMEDHLLLLLHQNQNLEKKYKILENEFTTVKTNYENVLKRPQEIKFGEAFKCQKCGYSIGYWGLYISWKRGDTVDCPEKCGNKFHFY